MDRSLGWRIIRACVTGTSHTRSGTPCQDSCFADVVACATGDLLLAFVSDGAGSASHAAEGSELAVSALRCEVEKWASSGQPDSGFNRDVILAWISATQDEIGRAAKAQGLTPRDYACTVLGAVIDAKRAAFFQVGDGAIVVSDGPAYAPITWPEEGEYANATYFVTDHDAVAHAQIIISDREHDEVALFSDGLQRLALVYETRAAHSPFFAPLFQALRRTHQQGCDALDGQLRRWLAGDRVNERTDDDKTLVIATRLFESPSTD